MPTAASVFMVTLRTVPVSSGTGGTRLPVKTAPTTVMADDGGVCDVVPFSRHRCCRSWHPTRDAPGETLKSRSTGSIDDGTFVAVVAPEGIVLEQVLVGRDCWGT